MKRTLILAGVLVAGCCAAPWSAHPESVAPDEQYQLGTGVQGYDVYAWRCLRGRHVVVYQYSAEMVCRSPVRETAPCGQPTPFEQAHAAEAHQPARPGRSWRLP